MGKMERRGALIVNGGRSEYRKTSEERQVTSRLFDKALFRIKNA